MVGALGLRSLLCSVWLVVLFLFSLFHSLQDCILELLYYFSLSKFVSCSKNTVCLQMSIPCVGSLVNIQFMSYLCYLEYSCVLIDMTCIISICFDEH